ncbi:MAG: sigma-54 dependent transcriptional regulator [candidate division Zixibacteria bacterium]|nr:sigma-54 dependent transcriptional regulator [candidate division Zixibacteria bacterium]
MILINNGKSSATILLVDDDDVFRTSVETLLKNNRYEVISTNSFNRAVEIIGEVRLDLIITDLQLNDGNGLELLAKAKEHCREASVIIQTAYGSVKDAIEAIRQGAYDYLAKPFKNEELLVLIEKALENNSIRKELSILREKIAWNHGFDNLIGISNTMSRVKSLAARVAATDISILITGESGTGKELLAKTIHFHSERRKCKFTAIDCNSISACSMETALGESIEDSSISKFGNYMELFEEADRGTIFLDGIDNMPLPLQTIILHILQESEIKPIGSTVSKKIDVRIIATSNKDLPVLVKEGKFRGELWQRLNVVPIHIAPLRERIDDIAVLAEYFIQNENAKGGPKPISISSDAMEKLISYRWPGNVREVENTIRRAVALCHEGRIKKEDIMFIPSQSTSMLDRQLSAFDHSETGTLEESLRQRIESTLKANDWNFTKTAAKLGIGRTTLWRKVKKYNISRSEAALTNQN